MKAIPSDALYQFVNTRIVQFHHNKISALERLSLQDLLKRKNPYLFKAKNLNIASELIQDILDAYLSSSEEKLFGDFLEELAIYIASYTLDGHKSSASGIDLEFVHDDIHYLISIKSGANWGNSSQHKRQEEDFKTAVKRLKQSQSTRNVQPVLGICYGKTKTTFLRGYMKVVGQSFWHLISGNEQLYTDIIEPIGYRAKEHNERFLEEKGRVINQFTAEFLDAFCDNGLINWRRLVAFNSGNLDPNDISRRHRAP